mmetsp:Transcript_36293/g.115621  ORF Transcript_36293/g.115621 Transcript_36293/m.115621 type:complete len:203 (+) Transcript_36293:128-736(+)
MRCCTSSWPTNSMCATSSRSVRRPHHPTWPWREKRCPSTPASSRRLGNREVGRLIASTSRRSSTNRRAPLLKVPSLFCPMGVRFRICRPSCSSRSRHLQRDRRTRRLGQRRPVMRRPARTWFLEPPGRRRGPCDSQTRSSNSCTRSNGKGLQQRRQRRRRRSLLHHNGTLAVVNWIQMGRVQRQTRRFTGQMPGAAALGKPA